MPSSSRRTSGCGSWRAPISNCDAWANHPQIGCSIVATRSGATYDHAGAPGPPCRNLYVHPTASSTPSSTTSTSTAPAACDRSHTVTAPAAVARAVSAAMSARAAER